MGNPAQTCHWRRHKLSQAIVKSAPVSPSSHGGLLCCRGCAPAEPCARCRHIPCLTPEQSWRLTNLPHRDTSMAPACGCVVNSSCSSPLGTCTNLEEFLSQSRQEPLRPGTQQLPCPEPCPAPVPAQELLPRWSRAARRGSKALTHPFDEEALLQHSSFFLHRGQQGTEQSPRRESPASWQPVPLHMICFKKANFSLLPSSNMTHSPCPGFFSSAPTCETLVKQGTGSDILPALGEVKQRDV